MPLFHSNAMFVGFMPAFWVGGAIGLRERFSASQFVPDVLRYGVTFWNYVGEPVHYVLAAIEKQYGRHDEARIAAEVTNNPRNKLRYAVGNGAAPPDIDRFMKWMGLEEMFELYGSTEAAISTFRRKGDPRGSVGEVTDAAVQILDAQRRASARPPRSGRTASCSTTSSASARSAASPRTPGFSRATSTTPRPTPRSSATASITPATSATCCVKDGERFLFFDGRTDDWIRKDGENFSAGQVGRLIGEHPDVALAVAYGVPCSVSDELVMAAIKLRDGATFDPQAFFDWCEAQVGGGSMDRKWMPDFVRIVDDFEYTQTQKVLVRNIKKVHFDLQSHSRRGDLLASARRHLVRRFTPDDYAALRQEFAAREKLDLLDR